MSDIQRLELTWVGKNDQPKLEPRLLLQQPEHSYGDPSADNMLIHGDNLLALKALETSDIRFKCIYIDPPFNTGQAFEHYDDGVEHSIWLSLIYNRLKLLHSLMSEEGTIFIHIDDNELGYLLVMLDDVFGRSNKIAVTTFKQGSATGHKAINPGMVNTTNFILVYYKNKAQWKPNRLYVAKDYDTRYDKFIINKEEHYSKWQIVPLSRAFADYKNVDHKSAKKDIPNYKEELYDFVMTNADKVVQIVRPDYDAISSAAREKVNESKLSPSDIFFLKREGYSDMYFQNASRIIFYSSTLRLVDGKYVAGEPLSTLWDDLLSNNLHKEGGG